MAVGKSCACRANCAVRQRRSHRWMEGHGEVSVCLSVDRYILLRGGSGEHTGLVYAIWSERMVIKAIGTWNVLSLHG